MNNYKTPGVYVEEISTLPPSVAQVATAVPAFIGFTATGPKGVPTRIASMLDFRTIFGDHHPASFEVEVATDTQTQARSISQVTRNSANDFHLYYGLRHFFDNGGGACYIVSLGDFDRTGVDETAFTAALDAIKKVDEPTLLAFPDALFLSSGKYYTIVSYALAQCADLQDRFTIMDIHTGDTGATSDELRTGELFRSAVGTTNLNYGAVYTPYLNTAYSYAYADEDVHINEILLKEKGSAKLAINDKASIEVIFNGASPTDAPSAKVTATTSSSFTKPTISINDSNVMTITVQKIDGDATGSTLDEVQNAWANLGKEDRKSFDLRFVGANDTILGESISSETVNFPGKMTNVPLSDDIVKEQNSVLYSLIKTRLAKELVTLPPSTTMAGIYAQVDRNRGVWKAPANVSVAAVISPSVNIDHNEQGELNVDPTGGKSINAIRAFRGKGILVWGGRTLAGNDNEWRYISVRRLFITIEESVRKASAFAVFEPNDASTWLKVKAMIDSYLYGLWQQGALAGSKPEASYFVNVGLGKTMTSQDILEGRMIVEIGIAAVRPAEFIILRFSHKLQEA